MRRSAFRPTADRIWTLLRVRLADVKNDYNQRHPNTVAADCNEAIRRGMGHLAGSAALYWGKAGATSIDAPDHHLLVFHCLDVAAIGAALLHRQPRLRRLLAQLLGLSEAAAVDWLSFLLSLHDLGKFAEAFQGQKPELFERLHGRAPKRIYVTRHDSLGDWLWTKSLVEDVLTQSFAAPKMWRHGFSPLLRAVTGHHGQPPIASSGSLDRHFSREDERSAREFVDDMRCLLLPQSSIDELFAQGLETFECAAQGSSWWLAGLAVLADWLGSNTAYFPYCDDIATTIDDYWCRAREQADRALADTGVLPQQVAQGQRMADLFPHLRDKAATPLQHWAETLPLPEGPQLYLLEDVTGAGKTEAAITLAYRLMAAGHADGAFIGLPTMATANAMFRRLIDAVPRFYAAAAKPSLLLAHAQRQLLPEFRALVSVLPDDRAEGDQQQVDETASARCAAWLADHNKKALLASAGVGTIDQALLAVLHSRHQSLRLLGLVGKVLVVDEVHACDAYMQIVLERLLRFHAAAGGSVILLSATLPSGMKQKLVNAYAEGQRWLPSLLAESAYPLAACVSGQGLLEQPLDTRPEVRRRVQIEYQSDEQRIHARIRAALAAGQCVAWVRNTVFDVVAAREAFADFPAEQLLLFHARFTMGDRLLIEQRVIADLGPDSVSQQRFGKLVIGSQVLEMSLDCDVDLMITDLAPIDRLIQRAGRLRRHTRDARGNRIDGPDQRGEPLLIVHGPAWDESPAADWFKTPFPKAAGVYPHHGQLWLTARALQSGSYAMPDDARTLIEGVFGDDSQDCIPEGLRRVSNKAEGEEDASRSVGRQNSLPFDNGYCVGAIADWWREAKTPTRLGEESVDVRLMVWDGRRLKSWDARDTGGFEYSTVRVAMKHFPLDSQPVSPLCRVALQALKESLRDKGQWASWLVVSEQGNGSFVGESMDGKGRISRWRYDTATGLRREAAGASA